MLAEPPEMMKIEKMKTIPEGRPQLLLTDYNAKEFMSCDPDSLEQDYVVSPPRGPLRIAKLDDKRVILTESGTYPCKTRAYDAATGRFLQEVAVTEEGTYGLAVVNCVGFGDEGGPRVILGDRKGKVSIWAANRCEKLGHDMPDAPQTTKRIRFVREWSHAFVVVGSSPSVPLLYDLEKGVLRTKFRLSEKPRDYYGSEGLDVDVNARSFVSTRGAVELFSLDSLDPVLSLEFAFSGGRAVVNAADLHMYVIGTDGRICVFDIRQPRKFLNDFKLNSNSITDIARTGVERFASVSRNEGVVASWRPDGTILQKKSKECWRYGVCTMHSQFDRIFGGWVDEDLAERLSFILEMALAGPSVLSKALVQGSSSAPPLRLPKWL